MRRTVCLLLLAVASTARAEPLIYEGRLANVDPTGAPLTVTFELYDAPADGQLVWTSAPVRVTDASGRFVAVLSEGQPAALDAALLDGPRWFELTVHQGPDDQVIRPRQRLAAAPAALRSIAPDPRGLHRDRPATGCVDAMVSGADRSGVYWIVPPDREEAIEVYCDQTTAGGGWALIYNSHLGINVTQFWQMPYGQRLGRYGQPGIEGPFYDGSFYLDAASLGAEPFEYLDIVEGLRGRTVVAMQASAAGFDPETMMFVHPTALLEGSAFWYIFHFQGHWSSSDHNGRQGRNCAVANQNVTQHYHNCWFMNLGGDIDDETLAGAADDFFGPHVKLGLDLDTAIATLARDGSASAQRVRRISRFIRWEALP